MKISLFIPVLLLFCVQATASPEIRFYKANNKEQTRKILVRSSKATKPGCHNFAIKTRVYKVSQVGFEQCVLFSKKKCEASSTIQAKHKKSKPATTQLSQGYGWKLVSAHKRGMKVGSWRCEAKPQQKKE